MFWIEAKGEAVRVTTICKACGRRSVRVEDAAVFAGGRDAEVDHGWASTWDFCAGDDCLTEFLSREDAEIDRTIAVALEDVGADDSLWPSRPRRR